jgi:hypothetical protein
MRRVLPLLALVSLAFAPAPAFRPRKAEPVSARVVAAMEYFRVKMPPPTLEESGGKSYAGLSPDTIVHLLRVARMLEVKTASGCRALMPYAKDRDCKLRFIAQHAINAAAKAYEGRVPPPCFLDLETEPHRDMVRRFGELIERMKPRGGRDVTCTLPPSSGRIPRVVSRALRRIFP